MHSDLRQKLESLLADCASWAKDAAAWLLSGSCFSNSHDLAHVLHMLAKPQADLDREMPPIFWHVLQLQESTLLAHSFALILNAPSAHLLNASGWQYPNVLKTNSGTPCEQTKMYCILHILPGIISVPRLPGWKAKRRHSACQQAPM